MNIHCSYTKLADPKTLKPHPRNPNTHSEQQINLLVKILSAQGWRSPITISKRSGYVVRGHGRLEAAIAAGMAQVPIDLQDYDSEEMEIADLLADNSLSELSIRNRAGLKDLLEELDTGAFDMDLTGYDFGRLEELFTAAPPPPDRVEKPRAGDRYIINGHTVICASKKGLPYVIDLIENTDADKTPVTLFCAPDHVLTLLELWEHATGQKIERQGVVE